VIGNPPYDVLASEELGYDVSRELAFYEARSLFKPAIRGKKNLYKLFICRGLSLVRTSGTFSFIVPMALLGDDQAAGVRKRLLETSPIAIEAFPQKDDPRDRVFPEAKLSTTVFVTRFDKSGAPFRVRTHPGRLIDHESSVLVLSVSEVLAFDPENTVIPSCTQRDWELAVRLLTTKHIQRMQETSESFQGEVNETNERKRGTLSARHEHPIALRGSNICLYAVREASQGDDIGVDVEKFLKGKREDTKAFAYRSTRIGFQRSSPQNNFRRIIAAPISKGNFCLDTVSFITEESSRIDLDLLLTFLNSKVLDWYFRLGSTNSKVNEYQFNSLPIPTISNDRGRIDRRTLLLPGQWDLTAQRLSSLCLEPGIMREAVADALAAMSRMIQKIESTRILERRSERAHLSPESQPIQDAIDAILFRCYGLSDEDSEYISRRLKEML
jgi:Eco57I restriction-modification methylase